MLIHYLLFVWRVDDNCTLIDGTEVGEMSGVFFGQWEAQLLSMGRMGSYSVYGWLLLGEAGDTKNFLFGISSVYKGGWFDLICKSNLTLLEEANCI